MRHILHATAALLAICVVPFGLFILFGPWIFSFAFGQEWMKAGEYARWLSLFFMFNFINKPAVASVPLLGIQRGLLIYEIFSTGSKVLALIAGFFLFASDVWAVALFSMIGVFAYGTMMLWIVFKARRWSNDAQAG